MKKNYNTSSRLKGLKNAAAMLALFTAASVGSAMAQEGSQGNTTIFGGAQMTFFGNHTFAAPAGGTQPGVILTERATATISYLNYFGNNLTATGVTDVSYVDGYVRKYGTGQFIFPVGDNGNAGQFAASADGTSGAYFFADPSSAVTSNLFTGSAYPALPAGGPFATTSKGPGVSRVSPVEYWDINGTNATPITLTWDATSDITTLTSSLVNRLSILGWDGTQWVKIPSAVDVNSILDGTPSVLTAGSITTTASIVPNTYTAYTFGAAAPDLTPIIILPNNNFSANGITKNFTAGLYELLSVATGANVQFSVTVPTGYSIAFNATQTSITPTGSAIPVTVKNADWTVVATALGGRRLTFQAKPGITIAQAASAVLGYTVTRVSAQPSSTAVITVNVINDATNFNYDSVDGNNIYTRIINAL
ncbi:hypothetical protein [Dyadobacter sp. CY356]|uniref:hypothetical protein n=1 Tax=Dyadobacter sp. CY356 TaxID=2906442 RepID=UPI001F32EDBC|nr:hypothetical protein [Dyadobacter sp. CY356]MCF0054851.1 hypothetical protein [Dyadobacter sp. CY356]